MEYSTDSSDNSIQNTSDREKQQPNENSET